MNNVTSLEQLKPKMQIGDYNQVAQILGCTRDAAKMRLKRNKPKAIEALRRLIEAREELAKEFQNQEI